MAVNTFLIKCAIGWLEREDSIASIAAGRNEALLALGSVASAGEAYRITDATLTDFARIRREVTAGLLPFNETEDAYTAWRTGDTIITDDDDGDPAAIRVVSTSVAEDDDGHATAIPTMGDLVLDDESRLAQISTKMTPGNGGGRITSAHAGTPAFQPERNGSAT